VGTGSLSPRMKLPLILSTARLRNVWSLAFNSSSVFMACCLCTGIIFLYKLAYIINSDLSIGRKKIESKDKGKVVPVLN
jgi:hypothetical protein